MENTTQEIVIKNGITLTAQETAYVAQVLIEKPYKESSPLMDRIIAAQKDSPLKPTVEE